MKKLVLFISLLISTNVFADELHNFDQIKSAVITGKTIHIAIDFSKCLSHRVTKHMSIGIFTPNAIQVVNNEIVTSLTHFTLNNPRFLGKPVYEFVTYTITDDNNINLTSQILDATNYASLSDKVSFNCKIDAGAKIYS